MAFRLRRVEFGISALPQGTIRLLAQQRPGPPTSVPCLSSGPEDAGRLQTVANRVGRQGAWPVESPHSKRSSNAFRQ